MPNDPAMRAHHCEVESRRQRTTVSSFVVCVGIQKYLPDGAMRGSDMNAVAELCSTSLPLLAGRVLLPFLYLF